MRYWAILCFALLASPAAASEIYTTKAGCAPLTRHQPAPDVAYQDGVTAEGWATAPADLVPTPLDAQDFEQITTDMELPLGSYIQNPQAYNFDFSQAQVETGALTIDTANNRATYRGRDLGPLQSEQIPADCLQE